MTPATLNEAETLLAVHLTEAGFNHEREVRFDRGCCGHPGARHKLIGVPHFCALCPDAHRVHEYRKARQWRLDFVISRPPIARTAGASYPASGDSLPMYLAIEIEGGAWVNGRHTRGAGFAADLAKYQAALLAGYIVERVSPQQVAIGEAIGFITEALRGVVRR